MRPLLLLLALAACASTPPHPRAVEEVRRGYQHLASGDRERAEVAFEHALEMAPDLPEARNGLGVALRLAGRSQEALVQFEAALSADPELAEAHVNRGEALLALGHARDAELAWGEALRLDPDQPAARLDRARRRLARARQVPDPERSGLLRLARRDLLHLLEARPDLPAAWHDLGLAAFLGGDLAGAGVAPRQCPRPPRRRSPPRGVRSARPGRRLRRRGPGLPALPPGRSGPRRVRAEPGGRRALPLLP
jgi:Tfp pilus assembly protein PilF